MFIASHLILGGIALINIFVLILWEVLVQLFNFNFTFNLKDSLALHPNSINFLLFIFKLILTFMRVFYGEASIVNIYITFIHILWGIVLMRYFF